MTNEEREQWEADERVKWENVRVNIESLHSSMQEAHERIDKEHALWVARTDRLDKREKRARAALSAAIAAYLLAMKDEDGE